MPKLWMTLPIAGLLMTACQSAPPVVSANARNAGENAERILATLVEAGFSCESNKDAFVHCNIEGVDLVITVSLAPTGKQLTLMIPIAQPACANPAYHAKLAKVNTEYFMMSASCLNEKTLIISHRSHVFRAGLNKQDLLDVINHWLWTAVGTAQEEGLVGDGAAEAPPAKSDKTDKSDQGKF